MRVQPAYAICSAGIPAETKYSNLDATALLWPATVVRQRRHVFNRLDFQAGALQGSDRAFPTAAGSANLHVDFLHTAFDRLIGDLLRGHLAGEGSALTTAFESACAGAGPAKHVALGVGNGDRRVVECRLDMRHTDGDVTTHFPPRLL